MEKQNSFVRFMLLFGIMLIVTQLAMRWLGIAPEPPSIEDGAEQPAEVVKAEPLLVGEPRREAIVSVSPLSENQVNENMASPSPNEITLKKTNSQNQ